MAFLDLNWTGLSIICIQINFWFSLIALLKCSLRSSLAGFFRCSRSNVRFHALKTLCYVKYLVFCNILLPDKSKNLIYGSKLKVFDAIS